MQNEFLMCSNKDCFLKQINYTTMVELLAMIEPNPTRYQIPNLSEETSDML